MNIKHADRRQFSLGLLALGLGTATGVSAQAAWPAKPVRIIVAYPAGGVSDATARLLGERLAAQLGVAVVVENRGGAGGAIGMDAVAKAAPDGYTLGFASVSPVALNPHLGKLPYDPVHDIAPVISVMHSPVALLATPAFAGKDFKDMLETAKRQPGALRWATSGLATVGHIMLEQVQAGAHVSLTHVPYKGGGQQLNDALAGQFELLSANLGGALLQHVRAGKLRVLAVGAPARLDALPQAPTFTELGLAQANLSSLFGIFAPARVPPAVLQRLNAEFNRALASPEVRQRIGGDDNLVSGGNMAEFARQIAAESEANLRIIRSANIRSE